MNHSAPRRFVVGISGASGAAYALRTIEQLLLTGNQVHLVVSDYGKQLLAQESGVTKVTAEDLLPHLAPSHTPQSSPEPEAPGTPQSSSLSVAASPPDQSTADKRPKTSEFSPAHPAPPPHWKPERDFPELASRLICHPHKNVGAVIASGSFIHHGMVVVPCSSASLGAIATGSGSNLLARAAAVTLKERRPLIIAHRESPLSLVDIENMRTLALAGAIIAPTNPGLYLLPKTVEQIVDFVAGKYLDLLGVEHSLNIRWEDHEA